MKNFTNTLWKEVLERQDWSQIYNEPRVDNKAQIFTQLITKCLDEVAPFATITIRSNYKFGLSEDTKKSDEKKRKC